MTTTSTATSFDPSPAVQGAGAPSTHPPTVPPGSLGERLRAAAQAMREGRPVLLTDDRQREDEADLIDFYGNALTGDSIAWFEFWNWLNANHFHDQQNFELLRQKTDLDNFADYCILEILSDNVDWPTKNWRRMRPRTPDGRWYWLPYDFDLSFGLFSLDGQWNSGFAGQNAFARALDSTSMAWPISSPAA